MTKNSKDDNIEKKLNVVTCFVLLEIEQKVYSVVA